MGGAAAGCPGQGARRPIKRGAKVAWSDGVALVPWLAQVFRLKLIFRERPEKLKVQGKNHFDTFHGATNFHQTWAILGKICMFPMECKVNIFDPELPEN